MRTPLLIKTLISSAAVLALTGCLTVEDKGTTEVGKPVSGEADFTVDQPDPTESNPVTPEEETPVTEVPETPEQSGGMDYTFAINGGAQYTNANIVKLNFSVPAYSITSYKISNGNSICSGGTWGQFEESLTGEVTSQVTSNAVNNLSIQFRDADGKLRECLTASIIHDNKGPDILFAKYPASSVEEGATGEVIVDVKDVSPISSVTCSLNGISKSCFAGTNKINLTAMPEGNYEFSVTAKDIHGYTSSSKVNWTVVNRVRHLSQSVQIKQNNKVDVLVVIDNSGSMAYEQKSMANRVRNMLAILDGLDYRIAVTTTDPRATFKSGSVTYYGDGDLIPIRNMNGALWVDSSVSQSVAQNNLGLTLQRSETGSGSEQGIYAAYRLIEKATTPGHAYSSFLRTDAAFSVLVISDEDESANTAKNDPQKLLDLISTKFNSQKAFSFHGIITKPGDTACKATEGYSYSNRYKTMIELTGGVMGSVCETDYAAQVNGISNSIRTLVNSITLTCTPVEGFPITVTKNGASFTEHYALEGVNMKFSAALDAGDYTVNYTCLK